MNIIITGVAGLLGVNFCNYLLENVKDIKIFGIDNLFGGYKENLPIHLNFKFYELDLTIDNDQKEIEKIFENHKIDYIFHFASYAAEAMSVFVRQFNYTTNIIPTAFLVNMSIKYGIKRFIFTSSMAVYGINNLPFKEDMTPLPVDPYGIAKYACELDLKNAYEQHGLEYCIIRPHNVYGKYQNIWDPYRNVIGIWMYQQLQNKPYTIYGDGKQTRAFSYIDDILPCLWNAALFDKAKNQIVNVGGKQYNSINELCDTVSNITENKNGNVFLEQRNEVKNAWSSYDKSIDILDYKEQTTLVDGIKKMWDWAKIQPDRKRKYWDKYELDKNIYSYWKNI